MSQYVTFFRKPRQPQQSLQTSAKDAIQRPQEASKPARRKPGRPRKIVKDI